MPFSSYFFKLHFNITFYVCLGLLSSILPSCLPTETLCALLLYPILPHSLLPIMWVY